MSTSLHVCIQHSLIHSFSGTERRAAQGSPIHGKSGSCIRIKTWIDVPVPAVKPHETEVLPRREGFVDMVFKFVAEGGLVG